MCSPSTVDYCLIKLIAGLMLKLWKPTLGEEHRN